MPRLPGFGSLRGRYLYVAVALTAVLVGTSLIGRAVVSEKSNTHIAGIRDRAQITAALDDLIQLTRKLEAELEQYVVVPSPENRTVVEQTMLLTGGAIEKLRQSLSGINDETVLELVHGLAQDNARLRVQIDRLLTVRADLEQWVPAMRIMRSTMLPANNTFMAMSDAALLAEGADKAPSGPAAVATLLNRVRYNWIRMVSEFRLFVANRFGIFTTNAALGMQTRMQNIDMFAVNVREALDALERKKAEGALALEVDTLLEDMERGYETWQSAYREVVRSFDSPDWRRDLPLIEKEIGPTFERFHTRFSTLQLELGVASARDITQLTRVATHLTDAIALFALLGVAVIIGGYFAFKRSLYRPILRVATALKAEATGMEGVPLPRSGTEEIRHLVEAFGDMREQVRSRQAHLDHMAHHDMLTGLPNRALFRDRLEQALIRGRRDGGLVALLFLDLDGFKKINDSLGHDVGDAILKDVAGRLTHRMRATDTVARLGGDEFTVLMEKVVDPNQVRATAENILEIVRAPISHGDRELHVTTSIGIALSPLDDSAADLLLKDADTAMYHAKDSGRDRYRFYSADMTRQVARRLAMETELRHALARSEFELYYQPIVGLPGGRILGLEALLRWRHPDRGLVSPTEFIAVLEESNLIGPVGEWVLRTACAQARVWLDLPGAPSYVSVNLSAQQLHRDHTLSRTIRDVLEESDLPPGALQLEVTEGMLVEDIERNTEFFAELAAAGVRLAIDDFGTGYSSLSYLKRFSIDTIKIDRSFVHGIPDDINDTAIVDAVIAMANRLGIVVVAEGVETEQQLETLCDRQCAQIQGFLVSPPVPADQVPALVQPQSAPVEGRF